MTNRTISRPNRQDFSDLSPQRPADLVPQLKCRTFQEHCRLLPIRIALLTAAVLSVLSGQLQPLFAQEVLFTREYHQLTQLPGGLGVYQPQISGDTVYFPRKVEDGTRYEILAVDVAGGPPRVVDTWVIAENGELHGFSYAGGPVTTGNAVVRFNGRNVVELNQPVVASVSGPLFSVGFGANVRDSTMKLDTGVYRITGGSYEVVLTSQQVAGALNVLPVEVSRIESLSSSADGKRFAALAFVHSERPDTYSRNGYWFITWDGARVVVMNENNQPYPTGAVPIFSVSGDGSQIAWGDFHWKNLRITPFSQPGGRTIFSGDGMPGIILGTLPRFFYAGQRQAVLMGDSGYAVLAEGSAPFEIIPPEVQVFGSQGSFQNVYTSEQSRGLFAGYCNSPRGLQIAVMRLNAPGEKLRPDAPQIRQYSLNPPFIPNDISQPSTLRVVVQSSHPVQDIDCRHLKGGLNARDETATTGLTDNGRGDPDEVAGDHVWSGARWVYPQATGNRDIRVTALSRDSADMFHAFGIEIGTYRIDNAPPPANPDLVDVVPPSQRSDDDPHVGGTGSSAGTGGGSGRGSGADNNAGTGTTGAGTGRGSTGTGSGGAGSGGNSGGNPVSGSGAGGNSGSGPGTRSGTGGGGNSSNAGGSGAGSMGNTGAGTPPKPSRPTVEVDQRDVQPGEIATVPVSLRNPLGTANLNVEIRYDNRVIEPAGEIIRGNALPDATLFSANTEEAGVLRIGFAGSNLVPADGTIAEVMFRAAGQPGQSSELPPVVTTMNTATGEPLTPDTITGSVRIVPRRTPGDFDGDGRLTAADALAALEMSVRLRPEDLNLDRDSDGTVTSLDASLILRAAVGGER